MQKNETFYVNKVLNGDNHFLRRQVTTSALGVTRQRPSSRQVRGSGSGNALALESQKNLNKSSDVLAFNNERGVAARNLDTSRHG